MLCVSFGYFLGALRRSLLYLRCNWVALNLRFSDTYNITYQKKYIFVKSTFENMFSVESTKENFLLCFQGNEY